MKRKFSLVMSAAMILSLIAPMTNALAEDIQTPETATPETVVTEDAASGGTTYYVDSTIGDDSNSGTSPETPWKSLDKVTATTFLPGDTILLKSGSVWNGEWLWPKGSGTADAPIILSDFRKTAPRPGRTGVGAFAILRRGHSESSPTDRIAHCSGASFVLFQSRHHFPARTGRTSADYLPPLGTHLKPDIPHIGTTCFLFLRE